MPDRSNHAGDVVVLPCPTPAYARTMADRMRARGFIATVKGSTVTLQAPADPIATMTRTLGHSSC